MALVVQLEYGERLFVGDAVFEVHRHSASYIKVLVTAPPNVPIARENLLKREGLGVNDFKRTKGLK